LVLPSHAVSDTNENGVVYESLQFLNTSVRENYALVNRTKHSQFRRDSACLVNLEISGNLTALKETSGENLVREILLT